MDNTSPRVSSRVKQIQEQKIITSNTNNNSVKTETTKVLSSTRQLKKQTSSNSGNTLSNTPSKSFKKLIPNGTSTTPDKVKTEICGENHKKILFGSGSESFLNSGILKSGLKSGLKSSFNSDFSDSELKIDSPGSDSMAPTISLKTPELKRENSSSLPGTDKTEKPTRWVVIS